MGIERANRSCTQVLFSESFSSGEASRIFARDEFADGKICGRSSLNLGRSGNKTRNIFKEYDASVFLLNQFRNNYIYFVVIIFYSNYRIIYIIR